MLSVVVLPAPLGPSSPNISPPRREKLMPSTATRAPYRLRRPTASRAGDDGSAGEELTPRELARNAACAQRGAPIHSSDAHLRRLSLEVFAQRNELRKEQGARLGLQFPCWFSTVTRSMDVDHIEHLRDGAEAFPDWLAHIGAAQREILLEMYWFDSDATGQRFAAALSERARAGVHVCLLYDAIGSLGSDRAMFHAMTASGVHVRQFHPIAPWRRAFRISRVFRRDHRKLLVVDAEVAWIGGINITDHQAPRDAGGDGWRDDCARFRGPVVAQARRLFLDLWQRRGGPLPIDAPPPPPPTLAEQARAHVQHAARVLLRGRRGDSVLSAPIQLLAHPVSSTRRNLRRVYLFHIRGAVRTILIQNAYFLPDPRVRRALERAAARGVEVRVILPRISDVHAVEKASQAIYGPLLRAGVHIHEWVGPMMHAKTALIDGWATTGSFNLDHRSLRFNLELNIASTLPAFTEALEASVRRDLAASPAVDPEVWARRGWWPRFVSWLYYQFRGLL